MANYVLINNVKFGTALLIAGSNFSSLYDDISGIQAAGGVLLATGTVSVDAQALLAQDARKNGASPAYCEGLMQAAYTAALVGGVDPATLAAAGGAATVGVDHTNFYTGSTTAQKALDELASGSGKGMADGGAVTDQAANNLAVTAGSRLTWWHIDAIGQGETNTLVTTGAVVGDEILVTRTTATGAFTVAIVNGGVGAGTLVTLPASKIGFALCRYDGTNWKLLQAGAV